MRTKARDGFIKALRDAHRSLDELLVDPTQTVERLQQPLHNRMLLGAERLRIALGQTADDRERGQLRLGGQPGLDRGQMPIKLGRHANHFV